MDEALARPVGCKALAMVQKRNHRVPATHTRARVRGVEVPVVNLSLGGACLALPGALPPRSAALTLTLEHPYLDEAAEVRAEVVWASRAANTSAAQAQAGVRFVELQPAERTVLRRCMLAEYGHGVWTSPDAKRPVGYVVSTGTDAWGVYDQAVREVGKLRRDGGRLLLRAGGGGEVVVASFARAAEEAFGLPRPPRIEPALDVPARELPSLSGSCVLDGARTVGYVARTGESWSFFDVHREPLGFMTCADGQWRVVVIGADEEGAFDVRRAGSYPEALAAAFALEHPPGLRSTVFQPTSLLDA